MKKILFFILILISVSSFATDHFIRDGATGNSPCTGGWGSSNACDNLPATLVRGDTYYIATGSYTGKDFTTSTSGTSLITIKKAIETDHGTDTGWQSSYGTGQAIFAGSGVSFSSNYWVFDGGVGSGSNPNLYGFYFTPPNSGSTIRPVVYNASNIQIRHTAVTCPGSSGDRQQFGYSGTGDNVTTDYTYVNNCQVSYWNQGSNNIISNSYLGTYWSSTSNHGVHVEQIDNPSFFNNIVTECIIQCIEPGGGTTTNITNGKYYNNVFVNISGTNGILKGVSSGAIIDTIMYGNSFINVSGPILYQNNAGLGHGSGNSLINNVLYNSPNLYEQAGGGTIAHSYNAFFDSGSVSETGGQIGSGDPFVSYSTGNYRLKVSTQAGQTLSSPYNLDITGVTRGADGTWDRGAYEYDLGSGSDSTPPTVSVTAPTQSSTVSGTISVTATASDNIGVVGVQFKLDGSNLQAEDTSSPYSISWDTTTVNNGTHTIVAIARDAAGNSTTSSTRTFTTSNASSAPPTVNSIGCSPTTIQAPGSTVCTPTITGVYTSVSWSQQSCSAAQCTTSSTTSPATYNCSYGGACTMCANATNAFGTGNTACASAIVVKYKKPSNFRTL